MRRVVTIQSESDIGEVKGSARGGVELRFDCPYCLEVRGKADYDAKLYFNVQSGVGFCFKCHTVVVLVSEETELGRLLHKIEGLKISKSKAYVDWTPKRYSLKRFSVVERDGEVERYLLNRGITREQIEHFKLREVEGLSKGVLIPNGPDDIVFYYQIRYINRTEAKYYNPVGTKPLFLADFLTGKESELALAEGAFDAISISKTMPAVAILGKYITDLQVCQLMSMYYPYKLSRVVVALDPDALWSAIREAFKLSRMEIAKEVLVARFEEGDPADVGGLEGAVSIETVEEFLINTKLPIITFGGRPSYPSKIRIPTVGGGKCSLYL